MCFNRNICFVYHVSLIWWINSTVWPIQFRSEWFWRKMIFIIRTLDEIVAWYEEFAVSCLIMTPVHGDFLICLYDLIWPRIRGPWVAHLSDYWSILIDFRLARCYPTVSQNKHIYDCNIHICGCNYRNKTPFLVTRLKISPFSIRPPKFRHFLVSKYHHFMMYHANGFGLGHSLTMGRYVMRSIYCTNIWPIKWSLMVRFWYYIDLITRETSSNT